MSDMADPGLGRVGPLGMRVQVREKNSIEVGLDYFWVP